MNFLDYNVKDDKGNIQEHVINLDEVLHMVHFYDENQTEHVVIIMKQYHIPVAGESDSVAYHGESAALFWRAYQQSKMNIQWSEIKQ